MDNSGNLGLNFQKPYLNDPLVSNIPPTIPQSQEIPTDSKIVTLDTMLADATGSTPTTSTPQEIRNPVPTTPVTPPTPPAPINPDAPKKTNLITIFLGLGAIILFCTIASIIFYSFIKQTAKTQTTRTKTTTSLDKYNQAPLENMSNQIPEVTSTKPKESFAKTNNGVTSIPTIPIITTFPTIPTITPISTTSPIIPTPTTPGLTRLK